MSISKIFTAVELLRLGSNDRESEETLFGGSQKHALNYDFTYNIRKHFKRVSNVSVKLSTSWVFNWTYEVTAATAKRRQKHEDKAYPIYFDIYY